VISNTSDECADIMMLFARGSSSNPNGLNVHKPFSKEFEEGVPDPNNLSKTVGAEEVPGSFFRWMEKRIKADYPHVNYKAISVHYEDDKGYSQHGYPAVGIFNYDTLGNAFQAKFSWWEAGEYTDSVLSGSQELAGHIRDNVYNCPNQRLVVGGYSQGAHVVHEALKITTQSEHNIIDNVVLFGDPKYISSDGSHWNPLSVHSAYPWVRGTAGLKERGSGGAQIPYVPDEMRYKTISWCHEDDFVCTGFSGLSWAVTMHEMPGNDHSIWSGISGAIGDGHTRYPVFGIPEATAEVMSNLGPHFEALEKERGGLDAKVDSYKQAYDINLRNDRPIDLMLALNYTSGNEDSLFQYFQKLKDVTKHYKKNFTQMRTGGLLYTDFAGNAYQPNNSYIAGYARQSNQLSTNMDDAFRGNVYFGGGMGGGGDYPENHGMLIERGGMYADWRSNAVKHLVIFAERPAQESYSFNMCTTSTINSFPHNGETPCAAGAEYMSRDRPQWCESMIQAISFDTCKLSGPTTNTKIVTRSLSDAVILARSKGFVVDIIQPHTARNNQPDPYTPIYVENQLKTLAQSTGGLYLKYGVFDEPAMRDAIWQILNHQPKIMSIAQYSPGSLLDFSTSKLSPLPIAGLANFTNNKNLVTTTPVSGARSYSWDFTSDGIVDEYSEGPSIEHVFTESILPKVLTVSARASNSDPISLSTKSLPYVVTSNDAVQYTQDTVDGLVNLSAEHVDGSASTLIAWTIPGDASDFGLVIVRDPQSGVIMESTPVMNGQIITNSSLGSYIVQYIDHGAEAEPQEVTTLITYPPPTPDEDIVDPIQDPVNPQDPDPIPDTTENEPGPIDVIEPPVPDPIEVVDDETPVEVLPPIDNQSDVGQDQDKTVTQDEPNTTEDPNSPAFDTTPEPVPVTVQPTVLRAVSQTLPVITKVAGEQDVKTDPQSEVGGIDEVNSLFGGEDIGKQTIDESGDQNTINWLLVMALGALPVVCLALLLLLLKKRKSEEDEE